MNDLAVCVFFVAVLFVVSDKFFVYIEERISAYWKKKHDSP